MDQDCEQAAGCLASSAVRHVNDESSRVVEKGREGKRVSKEEKAHQMSHFETYGTIVWLSFLCGGVEKGWGGHKKASTLAH